MESWIIEFFKSLKVSHEFHIEMEGGTTYQRHYFLGRSIDRLYHKYQEKIKELVK